MRALFVAALVIGLSGLSSAAAAFGTPLNVVIVTDDEAKQPDAPPKVRKFGSDEPTDGPIITFNDPTYGSEVLKPVTIDISFKERLAPVDLSTLEVTYLKLISIDITDRVREYANQSGIKIVNAEFPVGTHRVRFTLKDKDERETEEVLKITIVDE